MEEFVEGGVGVILAVSSMMYLLVGVDGGSAAGGASPNEYGDVYTQGLSCRGGRWRGQVIVSELRRGSRCSKRIGVCPWRAGRRVGFNKLRGACDGNAD